MDLSNNETVHLDEVRREIDREIKIAMAIQQKIKERSDALTRRIRRAGLTKRVRYLMLATLYLGWILFHAIGSLLISLGSHLSRVYQWFSEGWHPLLGSLLFLAVGTAAVAFRTHKRQYYGAMETGIAISTASIVIHSPQSNAVVQTGTLITAVYFFVRGMTHQTEGAAADRAVFEANRVELANETLAVAAELDSLKSRHDRLEQLVVKRNALIASLTD